LHDCPNGYDEKGYYEIEILANNSLALLKECEENTFSEE
jgi:hypothetical protein